MLTVQQAGKRGGAKAAANMTKDARVARARNAARARWDMVGIARAYFEKQAKARSRGKMRAVKS